MTKKAIVAISTVALLALSGIAFAQKEKATKKQTAGKSAGECTNEVRERYGRTLGPNAPWREMISKCQKGQPY